MTNSGSTSAAVLDFVIPKGDKGDKGDTGTGVPEGGEPGQLLSKTDDGTAWVDPPSGNVLIGTATGYVAHAEDTYAAKPREIRIKGRTVNNLWPVVESTQDGLTFSTDETGLITVSGTATASGHIRASVSGLAENKDVSAVKSGGTMLVSLQAWNAGSYVRDVMTVNTSTSTAKTGTGFDTLYARINYTNGETYNASFRVMLVEGTEAPDCFTPTGTHSVQPEKLVTAGKNLLSDAILQQVAADQSEVIEYSDGVMTVNANNGIAWNLLPAVMTVPPGDYVVSFAGSGGKIEIGDGTNYMADSITGYYARLSLDVETSLSFKFVSKDAATFPVTLTNIQLELGSTATAYEPPNVTEVTLPETDPLMDGDALTIARDGTAAASRSDGTTDQLGTVQLPQLPAPTFNAYPTGGYVPSDTSVGYERDVNIAYEQLEAKIAALNVAQATS